MYFLKRFCTHFRSWTSPFLGYGRGSRFTGFRYAWAMCAEVRFRSLWKQKNWKKELLLRAKIVDFKRERVRKNYISIALKQDGTLEVGLGWFIVEKCGMNNGNETWLIRIEDNNMIMKKRLSLQLHNNNDNDNDNNDNNNDNNNNNNTGLSRLAWTLFLTLSRQACKNNNLTRNIPPSYIQHCMHLR